MITAHATVLDPESVRFPECAGAGKTERRLMNEDLLIC